MATFPRKRAILIGADRYDSLKALDFCGEDVRDIGNAFRQSLQFDDKDIIEFRLNGGQHAPKRNEILGRMGSFLQQNIQEDELLVFYFSGHGMIDEHEQRDYLLPVDAYLQDLTGTGIPVDHVIKKLTETHCKNIVMFVDACREAVSGGKGALSVGQHSRQSLERGGIVTFFSCDPKEKSYEIVDLRHGSFTHCVLEAIRNGQCATVDAIDKYLRDNVPVLNARYQKPPQRPFTIINPSDKGQLAIFFREIGAQPDVGKYDAMFSSLGYLYDDQLITDRCFSTAVDFLDRVGQLPILSDVDNRKLRHVESLCAGKFSCRAFEVAWAAAERREPPPSPKTL